MSTRKLPSSISGIEVVKILQLKGFTSTGSGKGSHVNFKKLGVQSVVTVPLKPKIMKGTLMNILKHAEISRDEFLDLLEQI
jgi:predicted RNA binding protein YcfA (HicA-like mRNA interferase family)